MKIIDGVKCTFFKKRKSHLFISNVFYNTESYQLKALKEKD